jgi:hypothetical protein
VVPILTILIFFVMIWGFGYSVTYFLKKGTFSDSGLERFLMNLGIGLGVLSILIIALNQIGIPLDYRIFVALCLIVPLYSAYKRYTKTGKIINFNFSEIFKIRKSTLYIIISIVLAVILMGVYLKGSFNYPWLEDGDPWEHASGTLYVAEEKTYHRSPEEVLNPLIHYLEPYPPVYDAIMGMMRQTYQDTNWILKFFNVLMISLGHLWFYFFVKEFTKNKEIALVSTFALVVTPCFLGHFIWSTTLAMVLYFPAFYCIEKLRSGKKIF